MRLINVQVILDLEETGPNRPANIFSDFNDYKLQSIKYATLSHCWSSVDEEVSFREMEGIKRLSTAARDELRLRPGYQKILGCCQQARNDQLDWIWVDTCCINKQSSSEVSEAINAMFRWYKVSDRCYAYLQDVDDSALPATRDDVRFRAYNGWPKWFSRGWTLPELIAPRIVQFFNRDWQFLGDKQRTAFTLQSITQIPTHTLWYGIDSKRFSVAQIMSWAANRTTTRVEDRAYSLMGLFGVYMQISYGEGTAAFHRLQLEIIRMTNDHSILAWDPEGRVRRPGSVLADNPSFFRDCGDIVRMDHTEFLASLKDDTSEDLDAIPEEYLLTSSITNAGLKIMLPLTPCRNSPSLFRTTLACHDSCRPIPIDLQLVSSKYYRYFGQFDMDIDATAHFRHLYLAYQRESPPSGLGYQLGHGSDGDASDEESDDGVWESEVENGGEEASQAGV